MHKNTGNLSVKYPRKNKLGMYGEFPKALFTVPNTGKIDAARSIGPFSEKDIDKIYMVRYMKNVNSSHIITNNIKRMQNKNKRLSIIEYFKNEIGKNEILFLQETHSTINDEGKSKDEFSGPVFYSHSTSNSCGVLIKFFGKNKICVNSQTTDKHGRILILDVTIDGSEYILVNIYNANVESEQLKVLNDLSELIKRSI